MGRPILAFRDPHGCAYALTGSHRIAAAAELDMDIPVYIVDLSRHLDDVYHWQSGVLLQLDDLLAADLARYTDDSEALALAAAEYQD